MNRITYATITYVLFGIILFSDMGSVLTELLGFPFSMPELFLLFFLLYNRRGSRFFPVSIKRFANLLILWSVLLLIALISRHYSAYGIWSTARGWFLLFCMLAYSADREPFSWNHWMALSTGSLLGWSISSLITYFKVSGIEVGIVYGSALMMPVVLVGSLLFQKKHSFLFGLILILIICIFSGIRRPIVFAVFSILVCLYYGIKHLGFMKSLCISAVILVGAILVIPPVLAKMEKSRSAMYFRTVEKTKKLFLDKEERNSGDTLRSYFIKQALSGVDATLLPQGFVSKQALTEKGTGKYLDVPLFEITRSAGLIFGWSVIAYLLCLSIRLINREKKEAKVYGYIGITMIIALFIDGVFITAPYACMYTGLCLGGMLRES